MMQRRRRFAGAGKAKGKRQKGEVKRSLGPDEWSDAMSAMTRREFLQKTATDAALASFLAAGASRVFASPL
jgi:hypothetical protein